MNSRVTRIALAFFGLATTLIVSGWIYFRSLEPFCDARIKIESSVVCLDHFHEESADMYFSRIRLYRQRTGIDVGYEPARELKPGICTAEGFDLKNAKPELRQIAPNEVQLDVEGYQPCRLNIVTDF